MRDDRKPDPFDILALVLVIGCVLAFILATFAYGCVVVYGWLT